MQSIGILTTALLLPGNMCDARMWRGANCAIPAALEHAGLTVADADLGSDDTIGAMATRALTAIDGALFPVGFSMGAIVALEMARQALERVRGLALIGVNASADLPERATHRPAQQDEVRAGGLERVLVGELKPNYLAAANRGDTALLALLREMGMTLGPEVFVRQSEALRTRPDLRTVLGSLTVPVLLAVGEEDALCPPAWHRDWQARIADGRLHVVAGAGHMLPIEAPVAVAQLLIDWIEDKDIA